MFPTQVQTCSVQVDSHETPRGFGLSMPKHGSQHKAGVANTLYFWLGVGW